MRFSSAPNYKNTWSNESVLVKENKCDGVFFKIEEEYIGIKLKNQIGWIKIKSESNNGLTIENYAINLTDKNDI